MFRANLGEMAALATAVCWSVSAFAFERAGKRLGSRVLNVVRMAFALLFLVLLNTALRGQAVPFDVEASAWGWLTVSGLVGFTFGDLCLFRAFILIGPRLSTLVMALAPLFAACLGWVFLGERLTTFDLLGMAAIAFGIYWAVRARPVAPVDRGDLSGVEVAEGLEAVVGGAVAPQASDSRDRGKGLTLAVLGALGQAGGLVLSKFGMGTHSPLAAAEIRVFAGFVGFAVVITFARAWPRVAAAVRDRVAMAPTLVGSIFGPFLGVSLSLIAVQRTSAGVAASLMATAPVMILPVVVLAKREQVGVAGFIGAALAVVGVALLFA